jgi:hypothetical protein
MLKVWGLPKKKNYPADLIKAADQIKQSFNDNLVKAAVFFN